MASTKQWDILNRERRQQLTREGRKRYAANPDNKIKISARQAVRYAVKTGKLVRPNYCQNCNVLCKPDADHHDYTKPLDVKWLCLDCHALIGQQRTAVMLK